MLVVTGVMIGFVLVVMVGQTARTLQGVGWLPISPLGAQLAAAAFVIGSYVLAQELKVKGPRRRAAAARHRAPA